MKKYQIQGELGRGGMATVYRALDEKFNTWVAIKVLNQEFVFNQNIRKRFLSEARSMYRMSHPNIIKVTDLIDEDENVALVMEFVNGETLKQYMDRKGRLSNEEISFILSQMLDAVGYVHEQNLIHRDLKPSNFMIDNAGNIKLMDFGIAKHTDSNSIELTQTGTGVQMGTPVYMSPEQIIETKSVTNQSDIYSLGVIVWQLASGEKLYSGKNMSDFQIKSRIINENLPLLNSIWDDSIQKATAKNPAARFQSCDEWLDVLKMQTVNLSHKIYSNTGSEPSKSKGDNTLEDYATGLNEVNNLPSIQSSKKSTVLRNVIILVSLLVIAIGTFWITVGGNRKNSILTGLTRASSNSPNQGFNKNTQSSGNANIQHAFVRTQFGSGLRLRALPSENSDIITNIPDGSEILVISESEEFYALNGEVHKWYKIKYNNFVGWSWGKYIVFN